MDKRLTWIANLAVLLIASGCTSEAWYEGTRRSAEAECRKQPSAVSADDCLSRINRQSYREYEKARENRP